MKTILSIVGSIAILFLSLSFLPSSFLPLNYTESSNGLQSIALESGRTEVEMADINKDGNIDFLSVGDHGNPFVNTQEHGIMVWFGNGTGSNWVLQQTGNFGYGGIAIGDVNNDGFQDVGYGIHHNYSGVDLGDQILEVALGDGTGTNWTAWDDSLASQGETWGMFSTDFADVDNDGLLDVGSVSFGCCAGVHVYKNIGVGKWRQTFGFNGGNSNMDFVFGDINNDGNADFVVAQQYGAPYFGDGTGNFVLKHNNLPPAGNTGFASVALGDVNNDGSKDIAFIISSSGAINVWSWNNSSQNWVNLSANLPSSSSFSGIQLCDMNVDGYIDVIAFGNGNLTIWGGNGGSNWTQIASFTTPSPGYYSDFTVGGDADHNGYPDIVIEAKEGSGFNQYNTLRFFKESTPYSALSITPVYPRGSERIKNNCIMFVDWLSAAPASPSSKVKIELSTTGNGGPWNVIADSLPNNGRYQWHVAPAINSENCYFKYTVYIPGTSQTASSITPNRFIIGNLVGVENKNEIPKEYILYQNYPNPFNPVTKIKYQLPRSSLVILQVFDLQGKEIFKLKNENQQPGVYETEFDGSSLSSGVYFYKLTAGEFSQTRKMILAK
jgi:hypothetical protein